ncbi:MAG TPA: hypothetical protein VMH02_06175 [Verrucomicrobiae bacterium]|nr:hypothetical protein [Verrucomicrobiae bacterium]
MIKTSIWALLCALALASCSGSVASGVPAATATASPPELLFTWHKSGGAYAIEEYAAATGKLVLRIPGFSKPMGAVVDASGTLYAVVARADGYGVNVYPAGSTQPVRTITEGIGHPSGLKIGPAGALYVANAGGPIAKYAAGAGSPSLSIHPRGCPAQDAPEFTVDAAGTIDVICGAPLSAQRQQIVEYDDSPAIARTIEVPSSRKPLNVTTDPLDRLYLDYVKLGTVGAGISEYDAGQTSPLRSFVFSENEGIGELLYDSSTNQLVEAAGICFSFNGGPWTCESAIDFTDRNATKVALQILPPRGWIFGVPRFDAYGDVYVGVGSPTDSLESIREYPPRSATGWRTVLRATGLSLIAVWPAGAASSPDRSFAGDGCANRASTRTYSADPFPAPACGR